MKTFYFTPPGELINEISSVLYHSPSFNCHTVYPGTGAEIWLSSKGFRISYSGAVLERYESLIVPRKKKFTIKAEGAACVVIRLRHDALPKLFYPVSEFTDKIISAADSLGVISTGHLLSDILNGISARSKEANLNRKNTLASICADSIYRNPALPISEIAKQINITPRYLQLIFRDEFSLTPKEYQRNCRCEKILKHYILNPSDRGVYLDFGYSDQSHFCNDFKKVFESPPMKFISGYDFLCFVGGDIDMDMDY